MEEGRHLAILEAWWVDVSRVRSPALRRAAWRQHDHRGELALPAARTTSRISLVPHARIEQVDRRTLTW